ncbi:hypothetical protein AVANS14531_03280 [Campylobacter sp. Cr9]|uniref:hypothetical protein n=1 Tax=Campylobacter sp. Cr9 TaxID=2735728 RepID=UPI003014AD18|nr:hypothetical protein [Campylobacter sp. Cr9]
MRVLITGARAPVSFEWLKILKNDELIFADSIDFILLNKNINYIKMPSPRFDFYNFCNEYFKLFKQVDKIICNCEEIFYIAQARDLYLKINPNEEYKFFIPKTSFLLTFHNKFSIFSALKDMRNLSYKNVSIKYPKSYYINNVSLLKKYDLSKFILKPIYSRFGLNVIRNIDINKLNISLNNPYVLQEKINANQICNYAIFENGILKEHIVYDSRYLINNSAGSYFVRIDDENINKCIFNFMQELGINFKLNGQIAFDFLMQKNDEKISLYLIECNPRATSGLHFINNTNSHLRVGKSILYMFFIKSLKELKLAKLFKDYYKASDVLKEFEIGIRDFIFYVYGLFKISYNLSDASTKDIKFNALNDYYLDDIKEDDFKTRFLNAFYEPTNELIKNVNVNIKKLDNIFYTDIIYTNDNQCFTASLRGLIYIAKDELIKLENPFIRQVCKVLISIFEKIIKYIDDIIFINNHCFSTNLYEKHWENYEFLNTKFLNDFSKLKNTKKILALRCVNEVQNPHLFNFLKNNDFVMLATRQVYLMNDYELLELSRDFKDDKKLLKDFSFIKVNDDFAKALKLYNELYLEKYSYFNPQFSSVYLCNLEKNNILDSYYMLDKSQEIVGFVSFMQNNDYISVPLLGYKMSKQKELGTLYRALQCFILEYCKNTKKFLNLSSGAPIFKTNRKLSPCIEYSFLYIKHLPFLKRFIVLILSKISTKFYAKILKKYKL